MNQRLTAKKNRRLMFGLLFVVGGMVGVTSTAVPLDSIFCQATGYVGTPNIAKAPSANVSDRMMNVRFDSTMNGLDRSFQPVKREVRAKIGETKVAYFRAHNNSARGLAGSATSNVMPDKAGPYFSKIECFCFAGLRLEPGQSVDMPVSFFVDPAISGDVNLDDVETITLSYTFFPVTKDGVEGRRDVSRLEPWASA